MKVSVCIPIYNVEKYVRRCLDSVVNQTFRDIEVIVVDDCSPDNSMSIVSEYASKDTRIKIIHHGRNQGLMVARKTGYMAATGDYITFCDSDDLLPADAVETLLNLAIESGADIVSANHTYVDSNGNKKDLKSHIDYGYDKVSILKSLLRKELFHNLWAKLYRRSLLQNHQYVTYQHFTNGEDACLLYQVIEHVDKMVHVNKSVYYYAQNVESSTHVRLSEKALRSIALTNRIRVDVCKKYPILNKDLRRYVFLLYKDLESLGYNKEGLLSNLFKENQLTSYTSFSNNWYYLTPIELVRTSFYRVAK